MSGGRIRKRNGAFGRGAVAVVGAACRLPGAPDRAAFARLLMERRDAVTTVPADRFSQERFLHPRPGERGRALHFQAGTIGEVHRFDAAAFGISPREAEEMDPQQRLLLVLARRALEDAGWPEDKAAGQRIGVFAGASTTDWSDLRQHDMGGGDRYAMTGGALSILANRLSHAFDWRGPAMTVDTACSSGLVALHQAMTAIRAGLPAALVAGVNLLLSPFPFGGFWRAGMLSRRGRCQAFGAGADGYVRAEGGVALLLKPLEAALADGDAVRGVILASGVNAAGRTNGISLPDGAAQAALIAETLAASGLASDEIGYFEAHGTGTPVGDPIEAEAIAHGVGARRRPLPVGSAKSNIGHTEAASGLVGVLKALAVLESGRIPPTLHADPPNPAIPFARLGLAPAVSARRLAGRGVMVNAFGFGGTNGCAALARAPGPARPRAAKAASPAPPLLLSAHSEAALRGLARAWEALPATPALLRGQARHRDLRPHRLVLRDPAALGPWLRGEEVPGAVSGLAGPGAGVGFAFSGNGAQWAGMGQGPMRHSAAFRTAVEAADAHLRPLLGWSVAEVLARGATAEEAEGTDRAQPLLFALQLGIVAALAEEGIRPDLVLGHSVGEVAAAQVAGLLAPAEAARLVAVRSRHQHATRGAGRMAALGAPMEEAAPVLAALGLELAAENAPAALTVAGDEAALERLRTEAEARRWSFVPLSLPYAFHSAAMDPVRDALLRDLRGLQSHALRLPMISSVSGAELREAPAEYWWRNLREPVRFRDAAREVAARRPAVLLEIGPHPILQAYLRATTRAAGWDAATLPTLRRAPEPEAADPFPAIADRATAAGADPRGGPAFAGPATWRDLPPLPMEGEALRPAASPEARSLVVPHRDGRLLGFRHDEEGGEEWRRSLDTLEEPWLADHALREGVVLPAAAMAEIALEAAAHRHPQAPALELRDFAILQPIPLSAETPREIRARLDAAGGFSLESRRRLSGEAWSRHATGRVAALPGLAAPGPATTDAPWRDGAALTERARLRGLHYGPAFRPVWRWRLGAAALEAELALPDAAPPDSDFVLHPVRLDGVLQALLGLPGEGDTEDGFLPVRFGRIALRRGAAAPVRAELRPVASGARSLLADAVLRDALGEAVAVVEAAELRRVFRPEPGQDLLFRAEMVPAAPPPAFPAAPPVLDPARLAPRMEEDLREAAMLLDAFAEAALAEAGLATAPGALAEALRARLPDSDATSLPAAGDIWGEVWAERPALAHELALLAEAREALPAALAGGAVPKLRLSPHAESLRRLAECLAEEAARLLTGWPADRPCRVLVAGAEEGPLLPALRRALRFLGPALRLSLAPLPEARLPSVPPETGLVEWSPAASPEAEAELVLGLGLSGRAGPAATIAARLRPALAPGGALLLAEPAPHLFWDLSEGLHPDARAPGRLAGAEGWEATLLQAGLDGVRALALPPVPWPALLLCGAAPAGARLLAAAPGRRFVISPAPATSGLAAALTEALEAAGAQVSLAEGEPAPRQLRGAALVALPGSGPDALAALGRLAATAEGAAASFHLVVRDGETNPDSAAALALGRVLANEATRLKPRRHDLSPRLSPEEAGRALAAALLAPPDGEGEQRVTPAGRLVPRLRAGLAEAPRSATLRLEAARPGRLDSLAWRPAALPEPGPGEIRIAVAAAGLNFRDVLWAQNLLPEEALLPGFAGPGLGMEVAGTVEAVGEGAPFRPGDRVFGVAPRGLATHAVTGAAALAPLPPGLSMEAAAALPVAFLTALHALEELGRVEAGDRVLIHGGAGAVGLAALQVALARGARVAATAGTPSRRALLRAAGAELALDSRDASFADALRLHWETAPGEGCVDVCLNSLASEAMERSLGLMAPFGRFLELGKRDFAEATRVALRPLRRNVAWFAVDLDELARARPAVAARHMATLTRRFAEGEFLPLPVRAHPAEEAEEAFRRLQAGGHIGKLVIRPPAPAPTAPRAWSVEGTAVVTGGTGGFGLEAAVALARAGVRHFALLSRRGAGTPGIAEGLARLEALGAEARVLAADAADRDSLAAALAEIRRDLPPIAHVVHAAAVFADALAARMDETKLRAVWDSKVTAALQLDALTAGDALHSFVLFSSATVPIGAPGQGGYVAANAGLEAIARSRRARGLPALAVQWGPIADAGALSADGGAALSHRLGARPMAAAEALSFLPRLLAGPDAVVAVARLDWGGARRSLPVLAEAPFHALAGEAAPENEEGEDIAALLRRLGPEEALEALRRGIGREVARILRLPEGAVAAQAPLQRLGVDSLGGLELRTALERRFSAALPLEGLSEELTVDLLARRLLAGAATLPDAASRPEAAE
ncbi:type I polyketide synthase [Sabulicella glaciei]|uniref:SDR family NAD(P)-dependent oxidoreductase n=1 Tax=Sabulicella glaciei TaxID=2984948 RepID=A0ABT3NWZ8_9PROT|nr:type I polyketide synthase [Roseococcus sp. MDT2-1-1]MCW8086703.1 SDR family NAD(P)-dependent oxidoreductase [Roseococcus sp. MDT2-1-1]